LKASVLGGGPPLALHGLLRVCYQQAHRFNVESGGVIFATVRELVVSSKGKLRSAAAMPEFKGRFAAPALLVALAAALAGCETTGDPLASTLAAPGQYDLYDCPAIKVAAKGVVERQRELEGLMARANRGPGGSLVSATTYQPEYVTLRGKMAELRRVAAVNNCRFDPAAVRPDEAQSLPPRRQLPPPRNRRPERAERR
jgi:hypothetical protein